MVYDKCEGLPASVHQGLFLIWKISILYRKIASFNFTVSFDLKYAQTTANKTIMNPTPKNPTLKPKTGVKHNAIPTNTTTSGPFWLDVLSLFSEPSILFFNLSLSLGCHNFQVCPNIIYFYKRNLI
jgi:hypothetical protein